MPHLLRTPPVPLGLLLVVLLLAGCTDQALLDRVAELEGAQDRLRDSLTDLGAPDPEQQEAQDAAAAEVAAVATRITDLETTVSALQESLDGQTLELDGRLTTTELQLGELEASLQQLSSELATLTSRVNSLEEQLDSHRSDPFGHGS